MTGLHPWSRDGELPARAAEPELTPPTEEQLLELVARYLAAAAASAPVSARWVYARWKPGTSLCSGYELQWDDGSSQLVMLKRYLGDKAAALQGRQLLPWRADEQQQGCLLSSAVVPEQRLHLWCEGHDRELPGQQRLSDMRRTKRLLAEQGVFAPLRLRSHRSRLTRLRYRPERRAVYRLDACLRAEDGTRSEGRLAVRALPPALAAEVLARRRAHGELPILPRLLAAEPRSGLLFEEWLDVESCADDDFSQVGTAASLLATLHRPAPSDDRGLPREPGGDEPLFAWDARLSQLAGDPGTPLEPGPCHWTHGDFHPDQLAFERTGGQSRLLDLDGLAGGDVHADLASWIADVLLALPEREPAQAGRELLASYEEAGGVALDPGRLAWHVRVALKFRAAASLRRLQQDAVPRAVQILELARRVAAGALAEQG